MYRQPALGHECGQVQLKADVANESVGDAVALSLTVAVNFLRQARRRNVWKLLQHVRCIWRRYNYPP